MSREARSITAKPRETKRRQPVPEQAFHRAGRAVAFTAANAAAETGADELPLIAVSAGNLRQPSKNRFTAMRRGSRLRAGNTFRRRLKAKQPQKFQNIP